MITDNTIVMNIGALTAVFTLFWFFVKNLVIEPLKDSIDSLSKIVDRLDQNIINMTNTQLENTKDIIEIKAEQRHIQSSMMRLWKSFDMGENHE